MQTTDNRWGYPGTRSPSVKRPPRLNSIQAGSTRQIDTDGKPWATAFWKSSVLDPVPITRLGVEGDQQADRVNHGGPDKAICVYSANHYRFWRERLGLHSFEHGAFGENFTVENLIEESVCVGDVWRIGEVVLEISQPRQPCWKLARRWGIRELTNQVIQSGWTGWYCRVLRPARLHAGIVIEPIARPYPKWTIERCNKIMYSRSKRHSEEGSKLSQLPPLSESWRTMLRKRSKETNSTKNPDTSG